MGTPLPSAVVETSGEASHLNVRAFVVEDSAFLPTNTLATALSKYLGTNVSVGELVRAATDLQSEYRQRGYPTVGVAIEPPEGNTGIVKMHVFQGVFSQILVAGKRYQGNGDEMAIAPNLLVANPPLSKPAPASTTHDDVNVAKALPTPVTQRRARHLTPEEMALAEALHKKMAELAAAEIEASLPPADTTPPPVQRIVAPAEVNPSTGPQEALRLKMAELEAQSRRAHLFPSAATNLPAFTTNGQVFEVKGYDLIGNTLLPSDLTALILQPYIGTNISFDLVRRGLTELQTVYRDRGFATVSVGLPPQKLTNGIVKIRVFEGRLLQVIVDNNHYFSSNNVMRALPSLHPNMILTSPVFQAELDRANANQDRQIYPVIEPGPREQTTLLRLNVKDQLPLHAKVEYNNQSSPGTPDQRVNASAVYNNLWQREQSLGLQYSFSPEAYKSGEVWNFYDRPLVANYSGFYRLPLWSLNSIQDIITAQPGSFGYDEATRKFNLPAPSGRAELNVFASRSTIDSGVQTLSQKSILDVPGVISISEKDLQQDLTVNSDIGARLSIPLQTPANSQSSFSGGFDYKTYKLSSYKTNNFLFSIYTRDTGGNPNPPITATVASPNPPPNGATLKQLEYLPLSLRYDGAWRDSRGTTTFGLGLSANAWFADSVKNLQAITGSTKSSGHWLVITPSLTRDFIIHTNWTLSVHADAQWASEPLISNEQFGAGGVGSVRGYSEGEVFGDSGWRANIELKTPPHVVGLVYGRNALTVRGSVYMDYAATYLLDPLGRASEVSLWGSGFGGVISVGSHWDARFLFSWPLLQTAGTGTGTPRFNFGLTGQF